MPAKEHDSDAAYDLRVARPFVIYDNSREIVGTDIYLAIPRGQYGLVLPRSGLAAKHGITVLNAPGLIDSGYRGEVKVILFKTPDETSNYKVKFEAGDRIAQLLFSHSELWPSYMDAEMWDQTMGQSDRGVGGLGSTGVS